MESRVKRGFAWKGYWITDSTMDETGRFPVNKDYYTKIKL